MARKPNTPAKRKQRTAAAVPSKISKRATTPSCTSSRPSTKSSTPPVPVKIVARITPEKSPQDFNEYRVIKLSTGLTIALISRKNPPITGDTSEVPPRTSGQLTSTIPQLYPSFAPISLMIPHLPSLNHSDPECQFIQSSPFPTYQAPACHFKSTPPACYYDTTPAGYYDSSCTPADLKCQGDKDIGSDTTIADPSTILHRYCEKPQNVTSVSAVVNVGGLDDPQNLEGLAHFTEHMVHLGSEKFPKEDSVTSVLSNFGIYNATTRPHITNYYNEVPDVLLENNFELFSDMLTQPIFKMDVVKREVNAVDNEFYLRLPYWKRMFLQPHVNIQNQSHPLARFICGTLETLGGGTAAGNQRLQNQMLKNHQQKYVASAMTMTINSTKSLEEMQDLAIRHFSTLLQGDHTILSKTPVDKQQKLTLQKSKHVYLQGGSSRHELTFLWYLPTSAWTNKDEEPIMPMIMRMLSDSSLVGLKRYLYNRELIWNMYAQDSKTNYATIVEINFLLTPHGSQNTKAIEDATLEYLSFLQDKANERSMKRLFEELRIMSMKQFEYGSQWTSLQTTVDLAIRLQYIDDAAKLLVSQSWRDAKFNYANLQKALGLLTKEDLTVIQTVPKDVSLTDLVPNGKVQIAPHTNVKYVEVPRIIVSSAKGKTGLGLKNSAGSSVGIKFGFVANQFLKADYECMNRGIASGGSGDAGSGCQILECPVNFGDIKRQRLEWRSQSDIFDGDHMPKISGFHHGHCTCSHDRYYAHLLIRFHCHSLLRPNSRTLALAWIWCMVTMNKVDPYDSEFCTAGFSAFIQPSSIDTINISVGGFPRDLLSVAEILLKAMLEEDEKSDERMLSTAKVFSLAKQNLKSYWEQKLSESETISEALIKCSMHEQAEMSVDFLGSLEDITLENLMNFIESFKQSSFSFVELRGNLPVKTFHSVANLLERMTFAPLVDNNPALYSSNFLPLHPNMYNPGETCVRVENFASTSYTTQVTNVYVLGAIGTNQKEVDMYGAAMNFMNFQAFMSLRTKQQLGYVVFARRLEQYKVRTPLMMFAVTIIATARKHTACELNQKIDEFLVEYGDYLEAMPDVLFETKLKLTCSPRTFTKREVANWFQRKFPQNFGDMDIKWKCLKAGIKKQSIQILTGNTEAGSKKCKCAICSSITEWVGSKNYGSELKFAKGGGITERYFISSPQF